MNAEIVDIIDVHIDDLQELQVNMDMPEPLSLTMDLDNSLPTQEKSIAIAQNGSYAITPDPAYTLKKVNVEVAVPYLRPKYVTFWDFMGNILAAYEEDEVATIDYPVPPDYSSMGLTHFGWSETLDEIRTTKKALDVVCRYESETEKIYIDILVDGTEFYLGYSSKFADPYIVNWGDGSATESFEQSSTHIYNKGSYVIDVVPPAQAEGVENTTLVSPANCVISYVADKYKSYYNGQPIEDVYGGLTRYEFQNTRWLIHSYRHISNLTRSYHWGTTYNSCAVNDLKGRFHNSYSTFLGNVLKDPILCDLYYSELPAPTIRVVDIGVCTDGRLRPITNCTNAEYVYFNNIDNVTKSCGITFKNFYRVKKIEGIPEIEIAGRTTMNSMFSSCYALQTLDCGNWDMSSVTTMNSMFSSCYALQTLDCGNWDMSSVTTMNSMFSSCLALQSLIGSHTLEEVEAGEVTAFNNAGKNSYIDLRGAALLRYSSLLAVAKGAYDRKAAGLSNQTYYVNKAVYNACYNDDGTTPDAATIATRQAALTAILTAKGFNLALS